MFDLNKREWKMAKAITAAGIKGLRTFAWEQMNHKRLQVKAKKM